MEATGKGSDRESLTNVEAYKDVRPWGPRTLILGMRQNWLLKMESDGKHLWWTNVPSAIKRIEDLGWGEGKMWKKTKINLVFIDGEALPVTRQLTRSTKSLSSNAITCIPKQSRTVTYQCSFFIHVRVPQMECPSPWVTHKSHFSSFF